MTEGGGTCILVAHEHPDKLHTVGQPAPRHDIRLIDEHGPELRAGRDGRSGRPLRGDDDRLSSPAGEDRRGRVARRRAASASSAPATSAASTRTASSTLLDRRKDMIISRRLQHLPERPRGRAARASGRRRRRRGRRRRRRGWGETPVAFVVPRAARRSTPKRSRMGERAARQDAAPARRGARSTSCRAAQSARCSSASCATPTAIRRSAASGPAERARARRGARFAAGKGMLSCCFRSSVQP